MVTSKNTTGLLIFESFYFLFFVLVAMCVCVCVCSSRHSLLSCVRSHTPRGEKNEQSRVQEEEEERKASTARPRANRQTEGGALRGERAHTRERERERERGKMGRGRSREW